jgi:glycosyltransferase involved in cell wall biosynthesis
MRRPLTIFVSHPSDFITDHRSHGDGLIAYQQIQRLAERGHRLHVAYLSAELSRPLHENVTLHKIDCRFPSAGIQKLEYMWRVRQLFRRLQKEEAFDVIHQFHPVYEGRSALLTSFGVPLVIGVYFPYWPEEAEVTPAAIPWRSRAAEIFAPLVLFAEWWQQRQAAALLLSTPGAECRLFRWTRNRSRRVLLWGPGVESQGYSGKEAIAAKPGVMILFLGNLERRKGGLVLVEAFRSIWEQYPEARLVFVGDGTQREELQSFVASHDSKVKVEFRGELHGEDKKNALSEADLVAIPSVGEPYGLVALEAMASGKPMVATRAGGLQHLVDAQGGRLVPPGDARALAEAILELLERPDLLRSMGEFNRKRAVEFFDWAHIIDRLESAYYSVLHN